jgi:phospholipid/cholesterol/gamma-HCH transport system ATP-binding protein
MADQINDLIIKMQQALSVTSFVVTHDISSAAKVGDRLLRMYGGRFIFDGTAGDIMASTDPLVRSFVRGDSRMMEKAVEGRRS